MRAANASTSAASVTSAKRGTGAPSSSSRRRITSLSWAWISASGGGATLTPSATSFSSSSVGTCSWSKVSACAPVGRAAQRVEVGVRADHDVGGDLRGGVVGLRRRARAASDRARSRPDGSSWRAGRRRSWPRLGCRAHRLWCHASVPYRPRPARVRVGCHCFRTLASCVLHRCHDRAAAPPDPARTSSGTTSSSSSRSSARRTFVIDSAIFYTLKLTVLEPKPVTAKIIAGIVAVIASYILNREWSFRDRGGRERHHEALLFFGVSARRRAAVAWRRCGSPATC